MTSARAQDATWDGDTSSDWNTNSNWNPAAVPTGQASFGAEGNDQTNPTLSANSTIDEALFKIGAGSYTVSTNAFDLTINGTGITNQSGVGQVFSIGNAAGILRLQNSAISGGNVTLTNIGGSLRFETSSAGDSTIINSSGGITRFIDSDSQSSSITNNAGSQVIFSGTSVAGTVAGIDNRTAIFNSGAGANVRFQNTANAGTAFISNSNGATTDFANTADAGNAEIINNGGSTTFSNNSGAGDSNIENSNGGSTTFDDSSSANTVNITNLDGGSTFFNDGATAANATIDNRLGGVVDISGTDAPGIGIGTLGGEGNIVLGARRLRTGMLNQESTISGVISGEGGSLTKEGTSSLFLTNQNTYTGLTDIIAGNLVLSGEIAGDVAVRTEARFFQNFSSVLGDLTVDAGGTSSFIDAEVDGNVVNNGSLNADDEISFLNVGGDFTNGAGSTLTQIVDGDNNPDGSRVVATGAINLGGTLKVQADSDDYGLTSRYLVAEGASRTGTFDEGSYNGEVGIDATSDLPFYLDPTLEYDEDGGFNAYLFLTRNTLSDLESGDFSPNQRALFNSINNAVEDGDDDAFNGSNADLIDSIIFSGNRNRALDNASGDALTNYPIIAQGASNRFNQQLLMQALQQGRANQQLASIFHAPRLAYTGTKYRELLAQADTAPVTVSPVADGTRSTQAGSVNRSSIWATIGRSKENGKSDGNGPSFDARSTDYQVGVTRNVNENTVVGLSVGKSDSDVNINERNADGDIDSTSVGVFARHDSEKYYVSGLLSYSRHDINAERETGIGTARADYNGRTLAAWGEVGKKMRSGGLNIEPNLSLKLSNTKSDSFEEDGPGGLNVDGNNFVSRRLGLGVRVSGNNADARLRPHLFLGFEREFGDEKAELNNQISGLTAFNVDSTDLGKNIFAARLGADARLSDRFSLTGEVGASWRKNQDSQYVYGGVKYGF